jgi:4-hydroxythreonine-4-phosphate dehydrogenase
VDHGTALDLAGAGDIDPGSLEQAIALAFEMAARSR